MDESKRCGSFQYIFGISTTTVEGDSGAPVIGIKDGHLELIGMVTFIVEPARGLGYCLKINPIFNRIQQLQDQEIRKLKGCPSSQRALGKRSHQHLKSELSLRSEA